MKFGLLKNIVVDIFLWALLIAGFYFEVQYLDNIAAFVFVILGIFGVFGGVLLLFQASKKDFDGVGFLDQSVVHRRYILWSSIIESLVIAGSGHIVIASTLLVGTLVITAGKESLIAAYESEEDEENLA